MDIRDFEAGSNVTHCAPIRGDHLLTSTTERTPGIVVKLSCDQNYELSGTDVVTCENNTLWSHFAPTCSKEAPRDNHVLIIVVCTVATIVVLAVLVGAIYMIYKMCHNDRKQESDKQKQFERRMRDISLYIGKLPDHVGMPALVHDNMQETLTGKNIVYDTKQCIEPVFTQPSDGKGVDNPASEFYC